MDHYYGSEMFINDEDNSQFEEIQNIQNIETIKSVEKKNDEILIDAVRSYPHLYNPVLKEYKDLNMKENSWREIASCMKMSVGSCQNRWLRLREYFTKEQRLQQVESRSGSAASHRPKFSLYKNMLFLGNHIKRRKSYTNVAKQSTKPGGTDNIPNVSLELSTENCAPHQSISNACSQEMSSSSSNSFSFSSSHTDSNIVPTQLEIRPNNTNNTNRFNNTNRPNNTNFSPIQQINRIYDEEDASTFIRAPLNSIHNFERYDSLASLPRNESRNSSCMSEANSPVSQEVTTVPIMKQKAMKTNTSQIKNKNSSLESSLVTLSDTLQNRIANQAPLTEQTWNLHNLTPDKSFGLLVAAELERLPATEKRKCKQAIANILWNYTD